MSTLQIVLRVFGVSVIVIAATHVLLGPAAEIILGANMSATSRVDPTIDSQNRFYGAAFALYGVILITASSDLVRYRPILMWALAIFFIAGLARVVSVAHVGWPPPFVVALFVTELIVPPVLGIWLGKSTAA